MHSDINSFFVFCRGGIRSAFHAKSKSKLVAKLYLFVPSLAVALCRKLRIRDEAV